MATSKNRPDADRAGGARSASPVLSSSESVRTFAWASVLSPDWTMFSVQRTTATLNLGPPPRVA